MLVFNVHSCLRDMCQLHVKQWRNYISPTYWDVKSTYPHNNIFFTFSYYIYISLMLDIDFFFVINIFLNDIYQLHVENWMNYTSPSYLSIEGPFLCNKKYFTLNYFTPSNLLLFLRSDRPILVLVDVNHHHHHHHHHNHHHHHHTHISLILRCKKYLSTQ
jgi:hypothetical protein